MRLLTVRGPIDTTSSAAVPAQLTLAGRLRRRPDAADAMDDVLAAAQSGSAEAFNRLYASLGPGLLGYLAAKGAADPEELVQEVFIAVFSRLSTIRGGYEGLRTFAFSVAHARYVDEQRKRARSPQLSDYDAAADIRTSESAEALALAPLAGDVGAVLGRLSPEQRDVLMLRVVGDLSVEQAAGIMDRTPGAVKQLQRRALARLKELLDGKEPGAS